MLGSYHSIDLNCCRYPPSLIPTPAVEQNTYLVHVALEIQDTQNADLGSCCLMLQSSHSQGFVSFFCLPKLLFWKQFCV